MEFTFYMSPSVIGAFGAWLIALLIKSIIEYVTG